ncbi:MAG: ribosome silencing factor [Rickettsiales bacterium]
MKGNVITKKTSIPNLSSAKVEKIVIKTLDTNKAEKIVSIDLSGKSDIADRMVIASGLSSKHVGSLADYVVIALKHAGYESVPTEGKESGDWVLVDAGDVIVHIFKPEAREHYNLEKMWSVAFPNTEIAL